MNIYDYESAILGKKTKQDFKGKTFCFSGRFSLLKEDLECMTEDIGAYAKSTVTKHLDYLVVPNWVGSKSNKQIQAEIQGTKVLKEAEFLKIVRECAIE
jgi:NAD-dependent DNA ligase